MSTLPFSTGRAGQVRESLSGKRETHWLKQQSELINCDVKVVYLVSFQQVVYVNALQ